MALSADDIAKKQGEFEGEQLKAAEALYRINPEAVDLEAARDIGLISDEMRGKIEKALPNHADLFRRAYRPSGVEFISDEARSAAFKRAFEAVYGRFMLEQRNEELEKPDSPVMMVLKKVLRFPIGETGLEGRSELKAALRRLQELTAAGKNAPAALQAKIDSLNEGLDEAKRDRTAIEAALTAFAPIDAKRQELDQIIASIMEKRGQLADIENRRQLVEIQKKRPQLADIERIVILPTWQVPDNVDEIIKKIRKEYEEDLNKLYRCLSNLCEQLAANPEFSDKEKQEADALLTEFDRYLTPDYEATPLDYSAIETFLDKKLNTLLSLVAQVKEKLNTRKASCDTKISDLNAQIAKLSGYEGAGADVDGILRKAFAGVTVEGGVVKIRGFEANFKHVGKLLKAALDYFESPDEIGNLKEAHQELTALDEKVRDSKFKTALEDKDVGFTEEDFKKGIQAQINKLEAKIDGLSRLRYQEPKNATDTQRGEFETRREAQAEKIAKLKEALRVLRDNFELAKKLYAEMKKLFKYLDIVNKAGIKLKVNEEEINLADLIARFNKIDIRSSDFNPKALTDIYAEFKGFFGNDTNVSNLAADVTKAQKEISSNTNLTDAQAAKKIVMAIMAEQEEFKDMPLEDRGKLASAVLAGDVAKLQTEEGYSRTAQRGSAEMLNTIQQVGFREKLIGFRYKEGEKTVQPFKGLKPENFSDWPKIEHLFAVGRLNHQNGFFVLAAMESYDKGRDVRSVQALKVEKKLKELLAKELGIVERMDEAGVSRIVDKAFKEQLDKARALFEAYSNHYDEHRNEWNSRKIAELNTKMKVLNEQYRLGKITEAVYEKRHAELVTEAREFGVLEAIDFSQDSVLAGFWYNPESQWLRDRGADLGSYLGRKAKGAGMGVLRVAGRGLWGATKTGLSLGYQVAATPFRLAKYTAMLGTNVAALPFRLINNFFRVKKWDSPFKIREAVKADHKKVWGKMGETASKRWAGTKETLANVPKEEWKKEGWKRKEYKDRTKIDIAALEAHAKELKEKGEPTPIEIAGSPFIDLAKYKQEIAQLDKIISGQSGTAEAKAA